jgi:hypothetical protein
MRRLDSIFGIAGSGRNFAKTVASLRRLCIDDGGKAKYVFGSLGLLSKWKTESIVMTSALQ